MEVILAVPRVGYADTTSVSVLTIYKLGYILLFVKWLIVVPGLYPYELLAIALNSWASNPPALHPAISILWSGYFYFSSRI